MLQQTGVATVVPFFERWMDRFPTVNDLAKANEQDVLSLWQGLGYYRRCRNLLAGARIIASDGWPVDAAAWLKIPGVGRYTAGAIASIALGEPAPVVDGNIERVYARLATDPATGDVLNRRTWEWARRELRQSTPGDWNQALMELGATVCTPTRPSCIQCPAAPACRALRDQTVDTLPTSGKRRSIIRLEFDVEVPVCDKSFGLRQIAAGQWWEGMWEFPRSPRERQLPPARH